jgi:hypothetical protein
MKREHSLHLDAVLSAAFQKQGLDEVREGPVLHLGRLLGSFFKQWVDAN